MTVEVRSDEDIGTVADLAAGIWREHFTPIIGRDQVAYMLQRFQSTAAIADQIRNEGYHYRLLLDGTVPAGYFAVLARTDDLFLSKLYVAAEHRGRGLGREAVAWCADFARRNNREKIALRVNRDNVSSIAFYEKAGFRRTGTDVMDIGGGFVMDDVLMEKPLT